MVSDNRRPSVYVFCKTAFTIQRRLNASNKSRQDSEFEKIFFEEVYSSEHSNHLLPPDEHF